MSRIISFFAVVTLLLVSGCAHDFSGIWKGQMETPNGAMELTYNFKTDGDSLSGTVASPMGEIPISNGKVKGKTFSFDVNVNGMTIANNCTLMGDSISLKVPGMMGGPDIEMTLKRPADTK